jgi:hypothetical protein
MRAQKAIGTSCAYWTITSINAHPVVPKPKKCYNSDSLSPCFCHPLRPTMSGSNLLCSVHCATPQQFIYGFLAQDTQEPTCRKKGFGDTVILVNFSIYLDQGHD